MKTNKEKNNKLEEKIDKLVKKLEEKIEELKNEKSSRKRLGYMIKCKMLVTKIQRQQDLLKARKGFEKLKEDNNITAKENKVITRKNIIELNKDIKRLERTLNANSEYDFNSSDFMFPKKDVENVGGIEQYVDELEESQDTEAIETAKKIRETEENGRKLNQLYKDLREEQKYLAGIDSKLKSANNSLSMGEMMVTAKSKFNIFAKVGNLARGIVYGVKELWTEAKENRKVNKERTADYDELQSAYEEAKVKIRNEYERKMEELRKGYEKIYGERTEAWEKEREGKNATRRNKQSLEFQEELQNMAKVGQEESNLSAKEDIDEQEEPNLPSEEDIIRQTEEGEKNLDKEQNGKQENIDHEESLKPDTVIISEGEEINI